MKILLNPAFIRKLAIATCAVASLIAVSNSRAQTYETSLTTTNSVENFDELSQVNCTNAIPAGWVIAAGVGLPIYGAPIGSSTVTIFSNTPPINFTNYNSILAGNADGSGCPYDTAAPTHGGRINFSDAPSGYANRSLGFMSSNPSFETPTNHLMFGFYNNTGSNIISLAVTNNIKQYRLNTTAAQVTFYYSTDGTNWTHLSAGDAGPFPTGSSSTYYFTSGPLVTNKSFTISGINVSNGAPFYLDWQFVIASANGSFSPALALDDVGLTATLGIPAPPSSTSVWTAGAGNWNAAANWLGNVLPASGNNIVFKGSGGASVNNLASVSTGTGQIGFLTFSNAATGSYTITGNALTITTGVTNNSTYTQTIGVPLTLTADENLSASFAPLVFMAFITNGGNQVIFAGASNVTATGGITGAGNLVYNGSNALILGGINSYGGSTFLNSGVTILTNSAALPAVSPLSVAAGASLNLNGYNSSVSSISSAGTIAVSSGNVLTINSGGGTGFTGVLSGSGGLAMTGSGLQPITGSNNTISGPITLANGTVQISSTANLGTSPLILAGGILQLSGTRDVTNGILPNSLVLSSNSIFQNTTSATAGTRNFPFSGSVIATNGTLTLQTITSGNYTNVLNLRLHGSVTNFTQPIVFDNSMAASSVNNTLQIGSWNTNGSAAQLFSGPISGPGTFYRDALAPGTGGNTILSGSSTYTLGTILVRGYIGIGSDSTVSGGTIVSSPLGTGTLTIDDDTVSGLANNGLYAVGAPRTIFNPIVLNGTTGASELTTAFTGAYPLTLAGDINAGLSVPKVIFSSNSALTTISGQITNTALVTFAGPGVIALTADNSAYAGSFGITGGTLLANNTTGSATGLNAVTNSGGILAGTGFISGPVYITAGGSIAPGNNIGILTLQNGVDLSGGGALVFELGANTTNGAGTSFSQLAIAGGALNLAGSSALSIKFTGTATAPSPTNSFWQAARSWRIVTLSGGATISGASFSTIVNGSFAAGTFATSNDASGIILTFTPSGKSVPHFNSVTQAGNQLIFSGTNGNASATYSVVTATNVNIPLSNWVSVATGSFGANGSFTNAVTITNSDARHFFGIKY